MLFDNENKISYHQNMAHDRMTTIYFYFIMKMNSFKSMLNQKLITIKYINSF